MEGESGPKARPKGVVDGKQVNIPVLIVGWYRGTKEATVGRNWISTEAIEVLRGRRKTRLELKSDTVNTSSLFRDYVFTQLVVKLPRKARTTENQELPVPETDTGRQVEYTKGREITLSKELGKMAP